MHTNKLNFRESSRIEQKNSTGFPVLKSHYKIVETISY